MGKKKKFEFNWADSQIFDYKLIKSGKNTKSHIEKRKEQIQQGEVECSEWWLCWRK